MRRPFFPQAQDISRRHGAKGRRPAISLTLSQSCREIVRSRWRTYRLIVARTIGSMRPSTALCHIHPILCRAIPPKHMFLVQPQSFGAFAWVKSGSKSMAKTGLCCLASCINGRDLVRCETLLLITHLCIFQTAGRNDSAQHCSVGHGASHGLAAFIRYSPLPVAAGSRPGVINGYFLEYHRDHGEMMPRI